MVLVMGFTATGRLASKSPHGISNAFIVYLTCGRLSHIGKFRIYIREWSKRPAFGVIGSVDGTIQRIWSRGGTICIATSAGSGSGTGHIIFGDPILNVIKYDTAERSKMQQKISYNKITKRMRELQAFCCLRYLGFNDMVLTLLSSCPPDQGPSTFVPPK